MCRLKQEHWSAAVPGRFRSCPGGLSSERQLPLRQFRFLQLCWPGWVQRPSYSIFQHPRRCDQEPVLVQDVSWVLQYFIAPVFPRLLRANNHHLRDCSACRCVFQRMKLSLHSVVSDFVFKIIHQLVLGYFAPVTIISDSTNKWFSEWPDWYITYNKDTVGCHTMIFLFVFLTSSTFFNEHSWEYLEQQQKKALQCFDAGELIGNRCLLPFLSFIT